MARPLMKAVVTTGHGGYETLVYQDVPIPEIGPGDLLIRVLAAGVNNTDINTRLGWYAPAVRDSTTTASETTQGPSANPDEGGWNRRPPFPLIQGTDCCGRVVEVGDDVDTRLRGERVLVRPCMREDGFDSLATLWMGSDFDGSFAQFVRIRASEAFPVVCGWSDVELGSVPCAYGTSENMLHRADVTAGDTVLVTGASGGVGSATVQLARRRGARVVAVAGTGKLPRVLQLGADEVLESSADLLADLGEQSIDVVVDNVAGPGFPTMLKLLKRGGRMVSSGAIAGPVVELDMRDLYLKDVTLLGTTAWAEPVFPNLVSYIERDEILPLVERTFPLASIAEAQREFLKKRHVGKFVLLPWEA